MLQDIKTSLRISHNKLDGEILEIITSAKLEMKRAGVLDEVLESPNPLIVDAIKVYCKYVYANDPKHQEGFLKAWEYRLDNLRKSTIYGGELDV